LPRRKGAARNDSLMQQVRVRGTWYKQRRRGKVTPRVKVETEVLRAVHPPGSQFKGYEPYDVQDLVISARAVHYRRERWLTPDGEMIVAPLPGGIRGHFCRATIKTVSQRQSATHPLVEYL